MSSKVKEASWAARPGQERPADGPDSAAARGMLRLLRLCAVTGGGGRAERAYAAGLFAVTTAGVGFSTVFTFRLAVEHLARQSVVRVAAATGLFGLTYLLTWLPLAFCFACGRRRFDALLPAVWRALSRVSSMPGYGRPAARLRWETGGLLAVAVCLVICIAVATTYFSITTSMGQNPEMISMSSTILMLNGITFFVFVTSFHFIPLNYVFAGLHLTSGFRFIVEEFRPATAGDSRLSSAAVDRLLSLQDELSGTFTALTSSMTPELVTAMVYGVVSNVSMWLLFVLSVQQGTLAPYALMIALYVVGAGVTVAVPCEMTQRALAAVGESRDLLLAVERRQPALGQQLGLFRETVGRDLERLGDLGLFRLQRSSMLSVTATILTYVIVLVQFHGAGPAPTGCIGANGTEPTHMG